MKIIVHDAKGAQKVFGAGSAVANGLESAPKTHRTIAGLHITIENPAGTYRSGVDKDGNEWSQLMIASYGYIKGTSGGDGEGIDVFVKRNTPADFAGMVYIVDQYHDNGEGDFDEHKVMLGYGSADEAFAAYYAHYDDAYEGGFEGETMTIEAFKQWMHSEATTSPTADFSSAAVDELLNRLLYCAALVSKKTADSEGGGHEFHGNQWTGGLGKKDKPTSTTQKTVKKALHELLSSGHPFTKEELKAISGASEKTFTDAIAMLKNPKYAGPKGALEIAKVGDQYVVQQKDDDAPVGPEVPPVPNEVIPEPIVEVPEPDPFENFQLDPADPVATAEAEAKWAKEEAETIAKWEAEEAWAKAQAEEEAAKQALAEVDAGLVVPTKTHVPSKLMTVAEADEAFAVRADLNTKALVVGLAKQPTDFNDFNEWLTAQHAAVVQFKQVRLWNQSQWKTNTTGQVLDVKQADSKLYEADKQLIKDITTGVVPDLAVKAWKKNTEYEKLGQFPVKAQAITPKPIAKPTPEPVKPVSKIDEALYPAFEGIDHAGLIGADHVPISWHDFQGPNPTFKKNTLALKDSMEHGHTDIVQNKIHVQQGIEKRLADSPAFQAVLKARKGTDSLVSKLIGAWATSSGGWHETSNSMQLSIRDAFKMKHEDCEWYGTKLIHNGTPHEQIHKSAAAQLGVPYDTPFEKTTWKSAMHDFVMAQYHNTQDYLKELGVDHVYITRGMDAETEGPHAHDAFVKLQPASSFSSNFATCKGFGSQGSLFFAKVPREQVMGTYVSGYGCTIEHELVVLQHPKMEAVVIPQSKGYSLDESIKYINTTMKKPAVAPVPPPSPPAHEPKHTYLSPTGSKLTVQKSQVGDPNNVPAHIAKHEHYTHALYSSLAAKGKTNHEIGKHLAMKKFMAKKKGST